MGRRGADHPPTTVTADYEVQLLKPDSDRPAAPAAGHVVGPTDDRATVEGTLEIVTASGDGHVPRHVRGGQAGHPAFHRDRWSSRFLQ